MPQQISRFRAAALGAVAFTALMAGSAIAEPQMTHAPQAATPAMPDPQMQAVLDAQKSLGLKPLPTLSVEDARKQPTVGDGEKELLSNEHKSIAPEEVGNIETVHYTARDRMEMDARIYTPAGASSDQPMPVIVYYHGGGWVIGSIDSYDATPRILANGARAVVVSCEYRNGPEFKFPTAHNDAEDCFNWVTQNMKKLKGDPARLALAGESAGGDMAAEVALYARDHETVQPVYQLLIYPVAGGGFDQPSYKTYTADNIPLNTATVQWMLQTYTTTPADAENPRLSIISQPSLKGVAPATVITAEIDPLNSEGRAYASKLQKAGVAVDYKDFKGVTHEFFPLGRTVQTAKDAEMLANADLMKAFGHQANAGSMEQP